jgi:hypothetical protein
VRKAARNRRASAPAARSKGGASVEAELETTARGLGLGWLSGDPPRCPETTSARDPSRKTTMVAKKTQRI